MTDTYQAARFYLNGVDMGPCESVSFERSAVPTSQPIGQLTFEASCTTLVKGREGRALCRFIEHVARLCTPYARGRGLKKPRGRKGKARVREMWRRALEWQRSLSRQVDAIGRAQFAQWAADAGMQARPVDDEGLFEVSIPRGGPS